MPHQISAQIFSSCGALTKIDQDQEHKILHKRASERANRCAKLPYVARTSVLVETRDQLCRRNRVRPHETDPQSIAPLPLAQNAASVHHQAVAAAAVLVMKNQPAPPPDAPRDDAGGGRGAGGAHEPPGAKPAAPLPRFVSFGSGRSVHSWYGWVTHGPSAHARMLLLHRKESNQINP